MKRAVLVPLVLLASLAVSRNCWPMSSNTEFATCRNPSEKIVPDDWSHRDALLAEIEIDPGNVPIPDFTAGGHKQLDNIRRGQIFVDKRGPLQQLDDVRWSDETHGLYYSTQLHGLVGIGAVFQLQERLEDETALKIATHIRNWAACAAHNPEINSRAWYEGTVIKRQSNLLRALQYMRSGGTLATLSYEELTYLIDRNATYLLDTKDVYSLGNHGIRQDMLLAATALALPHHPRAGEMLRVSEARLEKAAVELFTTEGIWKEHAPGYVHYTLRLMSEVLDLYRASPEFNPKLFLSRYDSSRDYLLASLLPSGQIPYIGSSSAQPLGTRVRGDADIMSILASKASSLSVFPNYGHAIVRGEHPTGLYMLFVASQNLPAGKRHADDLSFILYNHGRPWISEGGHHTYERTGMTYYLRSPLAHNTYTVGGEYVAQNAKPELKTELTDHRQDGNRIFLAGYTERFPRSARFDRGVEIDDYSRLKIRDTLKGDGPWEGRFQLPGDLDVKIESPIVVATSLLDGKQMVLSFTSSKPLSFSSCRGQEEPICGWASAAHEFGPATSVIWSVDGSAEIEINVEWR